MAVHTPHTPTSERLNFPFQGFVTYCKQAGPYCGKAFAFIKAKDDAHETNLWIMDAGTGNGHNA
jgi:hypothetical protein